jgi:hypothetical protein
VALAGRAAEAWRSRTARLGRFLSPRRQPEPTNSVEGASRLRATPSCRNGYQKLGHSGKRNQKIILTRPRGLSLADVRALLLVALIGGCAGDAGERLQSGRVLAWQGLQGRWVGPVVPVEPACGATTQGLMSIGGKGFGFDPFQGTTVLRGEVSDDGHLSGRLVRQGADHQDLSITFDAVAAERDAIRGTLHSGRCRWTVTLHRG